MKDGVYVYRDKDNDYHRIKLITMLNRPRVYKIDTGDFEITNFQSIFYITRRFLKHGPLAFKASLASNFYGFFTSINIHLILSIC